MALSSLAELDCHKSSPPLPGTSDNLRSFYSPVDDVHGALVDLLSSAQHSLIIAMYGFDDEELAEVIEEKLADPGIFVQLTFDSSQAGGVHERKLLTDMEYPACSVQIGRSEKSAIMHMKLVIIDGVDVITGSTNWSAGGESLQDNQLTVVRDAVTAAEARTRVDVIHARMADRASKRQPVA